MIKFLQANKIPAQLVNTQKHIKWNTNKSYGLFWAFLWSHNHPTDRVEIFELLSIGILNSEI